MARLQHVGTAGIVENAETAKTAFRSIKRFRLT